nr:sensor domain-containing diguanylate cyclase [Pseudoduganella buxea]
MRARTSRASRPIIFPTPPLITIIWTLDASGCCSVVQHSVAGLLPELAGLSLPAWLAGVALADGARHADDIARALARRAPFHVEFAAGCRDGIARRLLLSGMPADTGFTGMMVDVTCQRQALDDAVRSAAEHRLLVDNSTDLIAHCSADGRYTRISSSYGRIMGWLPEDMVGLPVVDFLHPDDRAHALQALGTLLSGTPIPDVVEVRKRCKDGRYIWLGTKGTAIEAAGPGASLGAVLVSRDITGEKELLRKLEDMATRDALTNLPNRAWITRRVEALLAAPIDSSLTTVFFIDLNRFKEVNDTMGHGAGDRLLQAVGQRLHACMRPGDAVGRLGGDEFVVAARCAGQGAAAAIAQRLMQSLGTPFRIDGATVGIGAAIGISLAGMAGVSTEQLFQQADTAMYRAKAQGGSAYCFSDAAPGR